MNEEAHYLEQFCVDCQDETDQQMTPGGIDLDLSAVRKVQQHPR